MKNLLYLICGICIFFTSCVPTKTLVDTSCPGYRNVDFIRSNISEKGIGIMPVLGGEEKEQYRRPMGEAITKYFRKEFGNENVRSVREVIRILNDSSLSGEYSKAISDYQTTGIVPREMVYKLGMALNVDYLLYTRLLADTEVEVIQSGYGYYSTTIRIDEIYIQCQVWDTRLGDVSWEGKGGIAKLPKDTSDVINFTAIGLSKVVGKNKNDGPCETKKDLLNSVKQANTNTYVAILLISGLATLIPLLMLL